MPWVGIYFRCASEVLGMPCGPLARNRGVRKSGVMQYDATERSPMPEPLSDREPRGVVCRPPIALLFAGAIGFFGSDILRSWIHLNDLASFVILVAIVLIVHSAWCWLEKPN
jgi:hypothetical protein